MKIWDIKCPVKSCYRLWTPLPSRAESACKHKPFNASWTAKKTQVRHRLPYFGQLCSGNNYSKGIDNPLGSGSTLSHRSFLIQCKNQGPWTGEMIKLHGKFQFWFVIPKRFKSWGFFALEQSESLLSIPSWCILKQSLSLLMKCQARIRSLSLYPMGVYAEAIVLKSDQNTFY